MVFLLRSRKARRGRIALGVYIAVESPLNSFVDIGMLSLVLRTHIALFLFVPELARLSFFAARLLILGLPPPLPSNFSLEP